MGKHMQKGKDLLQILNLKGAEKNRKSIQSDVAFSSQDGSQLAQVLPENFQGNSFGLFPLYKVVAEYIHC